MSEQNTTNNIAIAQNLGRVRIIPQGTWSLNTQYVPLDIVIDSSNNCTYICIASCKNKQPNIKENIGKYWQLLVAGSTSGVTVGTDGILRWN